MSSKPAWTMPEWPFVAPWHASSAASIISTLAVVFESSRATAAPMQPAPMMTTSYEPSALAALWRVIERGHGVFATDSPLPPLMLNLSLQSLSGTQYPPTYAPPSPCTSPWVMPAIIGGAARRVERATGPAKNALAGTRVAIIRSRPDIEALRLGDTRLVSRGL